MEASNIRVLALNVLKEPGVLASGIRVPELKSCPKCRKEILSDPPQSITILSCNHVFHRACIEKDLLNSESGEERCPIPGCHKDVEIIKVNADLSPTRSDILVLGASTQDTIEGNETSSDEPDIAEFLDTTGNNEEPVSEAHDGEPVSEAHDSELVSKTPNLPVPTWIKENISQRLANANEKNDAEYELLKDLGLLEEPLEAEQVQSKNQTSVNNGNVKATVQATSVNEEQGQEHNSLNKESQPEKTITPTASVSINEKSTSSLKRNSISETSTRLDANEGSRPAKVPRNDSTPVASDKKEKESHMLKGLIEELLTDSSEVFEDLPLDGNADDFLYLYNKIVNAEVNNEIANQEVIRCYYYLGKVLSQRFKYHFEKSYNEHTAQMDVNKEFGERLPGNIMKSTIRKKAERARKIYMLFCDNREGLIRRVQTYSATSISKLSVDDIAYVIAQIKAKSSHS